MKIDEFRGKYFFLSNFYDAPIKYGDITYRNNEAAFQAQKCTNEADRIRFADLSGREAKHLGREVELRADWEMVKNEIMRDIVRAKFTQNERLMEWLIATENAYIEEGNRWGDRYWGTVNGVGENRLGKILMMLRSEILTERSISQIPTGKPVDFPAKNFMTYTDIRKEAQNRLNAKSRHEAWLYLENMADSGCIDKTDARWIFSDILSENNSV